MKLHGYCKCCRKMKRVNVLWPRPSGVQIGVCDDCEAKR